MKPLQTTQRVLTWVCGVPPNESDTKREKIQYIVLTFFIVIVYVSTSISSTVFIYRNVSVDLEQTLFCLYHLIAGLQALYQSIATIFLRHKLNSIFESLNKFYTENKNGDLFQLLNKTNEKCEWIWPIGFKYVVGYVVSTITFAAVSVLFSNIAYGHFEAEHVYYPLKYVLPWNQSTLPGYSLEIGLGLVVGVSYLFSNGSLLILFISMCLHHQTFYEIFRNEAKKLDHRDEQRNDSDHLHKMISFHISIKDWFLDSAAAYSTFVLIILMISMLSSACCVFQVDLQMKHPDSGLYVILTGILTALSNLFAYCYLGKMATESYERIAQCLYKCNWYGLDLKLEKHFVIMMINAQKPIYYHGFGVAVLNLETFNKMIRAVFTYYMLFKTLTSD